MNDPSKLFKLLAPYQGTDLNEKTPVKYVAENYALLIGSNTYEYNKLLDTTNTIITQSKNPKQDLITFVKGAVLSKPYGLSRYASNISSVLENNYTNINAAINSWLEDEFRNTHEDLFKKLKHLEYENANTLFEIKNSKNPTEIKQVVNKTNACIGDDPLSFFEQVSSDVGTIYLLAIQRDKKDKFKDMQKGTSGIGYVRLNPYQGEDKKELSLSVDNLWINNNDKQMVCSLVHALLDLSKHLELPIIDKTMSKNYLMQNEKLLDLYVPSQNLFKLGHTPEIMRYNKLAFQNNNESESFYLINNDLSKKK